MKKFILIAAISLAALNAKSQKLEKPDIDKITGDTTYATKEEKIATPMIGHWMAVSVSRKKNYVFLYCHLKDNFAQHYYVSEGDKATIKLADGKLVEISAARYEHSSFVPGADPIVTQSFPAFYLTPADVAALKTGKITVLRINTSEGNFDYEIKDSKSGIIQKQLELITK